MKSEEEAKKSMGRNGKRGVLKKWSGLQTRMTISYVGVSLVIVLLLELLVFLGIFYALTDSPLIGAVLSNTAQHTAQVYALEAALQGGRTALDRHTTFQPGHPSSLDVLGDDSSQPGRPSSSPLLREVFSERVPYIDTRSSPSQDAAFALLIAPNGQVLASSYPARYPVSTPVAHLLPNQALLILKALAGRSGSTAVDSTQGHVASAAQTVWSREKKPLGAVYVQVPSELVDEQIYSNLAWGWLRSGLPWLIFMIPVGGVFGFMTTRGLVRRIRRLATTTTQFAAGQYDQRLPALEKDEVGQLEQSFNQMAEQLVESMAQRQILIEQNARQAERARIEQELRTAQHIQQALLPKDVPVLPGWQFTPYYKPANEVGGDFYDFLSFDDGRLGIVLGDVSGKGVPAALVMAITRTMLRTAAQATTSPGKVLAQVNELLSADVPPGVFVTCFYALLDPGSGRLLYANAGQDLPYRQYSGGVSELWATGMPLGMMPGMCYEEREVTLTPGDNILFYSDGLVEAHNAMRDMFGFPHLMALLGEHPGGPTLIEFLLNELATFTGSEWEQEDDVTLVTLCRDSLAEPRQEQQDPWHLLAEWAIPSVLGNERQAMEQVTDAVQSLHLPLERLEDLKTAVAEATMNAMEHGNQYRPNTVVTLQLLTSQTAIAVRIRDQGEGEHQPISNTKEPDLDAMLTEQQAPRGWGLFLINNLVDELHVNSDEHSHTVELIMYREGVNDGKQQS